MAEKILNAVIKLRRDNDYNYNKVKSTFIPAKGEPILVDTAKEGLRIKIGDGVSTYDTLSYIDDLFIYGYYQDGEFYQDDKYETVLPSVTNKIYINKSDSKIYYFNGIEYLTVVGVPGASATVPGIMMLYNTTGQNIDGTMTQKAITDELNEKFEMDVDEEEETLIFAHDL